MFGGDSASNGWVPSEVVPGAAVMAHVPAAAYTVVYTYPLVMVMKMAETPQVCNTEMRAKPCCCLPVSPRGQMRMFHKALALGKSK